jgi:hypothetical protein
MGKSSSSDAKPSKTSKCIAKFVSAITATFSVCMMVVCVHNNYFICYVSLTILRPTAKAAGKSTALATKSVVT